MLGPDRVDVPCLAHGARDGIRPQVLGTESRHGVGSECVPERFERGLEIHLSGRDPQPIAERGESLPRERRPQPVSYGALFFGDREGHERPAGAVRRKRMPRVHASSGLSQHVAGVGAQREGDLAPDAHPFEQAAARHPIQHRPRRRGGDRCTLEHLEQHTRAHGLVDAVDDKLAEQGEQELLGLPSAHVLFHPVDQGSSIAPHARRSGGSLPPAWRAGSVRRRACAAR